MLDSYGLYFGETLSATVSEYSVRILVGAIIASGLVLFLASALHNKYHFTKKAFYTVLSGITVATTAAFVVIHIFAMTNSTTSSVERREARFVLSVCEQQLPITTDALFSSSAGTARHKIFEEGRLEYLGYVSDPLRDVSLGSFFEAFGGSINANIMTLPYPQEVESRLANTVQLNQFIRTNPIGERYLEIQNGTSCETFPSMISVYSYRYSDSKDAFVRSKVVRPEEYIVSDQPYDKADCIVVLFGEPSENTNLRCGDYPDADRIVTTTESEGTL